MTDEPRTNQTSTISGASLASNELQSFRDFIVEMFQAHNISEADRDAVMAVLFDSKTVQLPEMQVGQYRRALRLQDEDAARGLFPDSPNPLDTAALALCCQAERWIDELCDIEEAPGGHGSSRWWQVMFWLARLQGDIDSHVAAKRRYRNQQRAASKEGRAKGDEVRELVLASFDARKADWTNYNEAAHALWSAHQGPSATAVWDTHATLRTFLARKRQGVYSNVGGRPKKTAVSAPK